MLTFSWGVEGATGAGSRQKGGTRQTEARGSIGSEKPKRKLGIVSDLASVKSQKNKSLCLVSATFFSINNNFHIPLFHLYV